MLTIIHGSDTALSRKYFLDEKQKLKDAILIEAEKVDLTELAQLFEGGGLFGETKYLFIEQLLTKRKKSSDFKDILTYLEKNAGENTIFLWEGKELERGTLNALKKAVVRTFKFPQTLFQLLDAILPDNNKTLIKLFHQTIETTEPEMIFFMLIRQIRILLALSSFVIPVKTGIQKRMDPRIRDDDKENIIDEIKRIQPWQKGKLEKQARLFEPTHLLDLYDKLFQIEVGQKTGTLNTPLVSAIDFFLLEV